MKIDPVVTFWISLVTTIAQGIASGTVHLTGLVPDAYIPYVTGWLGLIVFVNMSFLTALSGFSSAKPGPLAAPPTLPEAREVMAAAQKAASVVLLGVVLSALLATEVRAADRVPTPPPRPPSIILPSTPLICDPLNLIPGCKQQNPLGPTGASVDMAKLWAQILSAAAADLDYATALANASGTAGGAIRARCYAALLDVNKKASGVDLKSADGSPMVQPDPHLLTDVEKLSQVIDNLSPTGQLVSECAAAAQAMKMNVMVFVGTILSGAAGLSILGGT